MYAGTPMHIQNRSDLYAETPTDLPPEGIHDAELVSVEVFASPFGERVGLVFRLGNGTELMQSASPGSPKGKLAEFLQPLGGTEGTAKAAKAVIGQRCRVAIRHGVNKSGKHYAGIAHTYGCQRAGEAEPTATGRIG